MLAAEHDDSELVCDSLRYVEPVQLGVLAEFRCMALNDLFYADVLWPLDLVPLTDFTYKYHPE